MSLSALGYYSYKFLTAPKPKKTIPLVQVTNVIGSPITKNITVDNKVIYEVEGSFTNIPIKYGNGPLYKGDFVVRGDVLKQYIPVFLGFC